MGWVLAGRQQPADGHSNPGRNCGATHGPSLDCFAQQLSWITAAAGTPREAGGLTSTRIDILAQDCKKNVVTQLMKWRADFSKFAPKLR